MLVDFIPGLASEVPPQIKSDVYLSSVYNLVLRIVHFALMRASALLMAVRAASPGSGLKHI